MVLYLDRVELLETVRRAARWRAYLVRAGAVRAPRSLGPGAAAVALTFDDGPDPESTPQVLDVLARHGATATFFCVGHRARSHPELLRRVQAEGHAIGSHSSTHRVSGLRPRAVLADFDEGHSAVEEVLGRPVRLFRPPHGNLDWGVVPGLRVRPFRTWLWTVDSGDYEPGATTESIARRAGAATAGDVVLMHDALEEAAPGAPPRTTMVDALPEVLEGLRARGLRTVALQ